MNFKKITRMQSIKESFNSKFKKQRTSCGEKTIYYGKDGFEVITKALRQNSSNIVRLSHYQARLVFEYLREINFSKKTFFPKDFRINATVGVITAFSLEHIAGELLKSLKTVDVVCFERMDKEEYLLIKSFPDTATRFVVVEQKEQSMISNTPLLEHLEGKKVLVISPYDELIKVQHLHQYLFHKDLTSAKGSFDLLTLSPDQIYEKNGAYTLFDKLDSLKVEILKYNFDIALVNLSILSIQVNAFIASLGKTVIELDEELLRVFGIAKDSAEKSKHDGYWVDLSSYNSGQEKSFLVTGVIGAPIKLKKGKIKKK